MSPKKSKQDLKEDKDIKDIEEIKSEEFQDEFSEEETESQQKPDEPKSEGPDFWAEEDNPWKEAEGEEPDEDDKAAEKEISKKSKTHVSKKDKDLVSKALKAEEKIKSSWYIIDLNGKLHKLKIKSKAVSGFNFKKFPNLKKFALYEMAKSRTDSKHPIHVDLMRKLQLADYEPASDPGNFRYYPNGSLIRDLIIDLVDLFVFRYNAMKVETPIMYDMDHPTLKSYLDRFPARQYVLESAKKNFFLRFAACFGQFLMAKDAIISYKNLPMKIYELAKYSFRMEQRGELAGLRRLRAFIMPDCHCLCKDTEQAKEEMMTRFDLAKRFQADVGFDFPNEFELGLRIVRSFYEENTDFVKNMVKSFGKPALVEMWDEQFAYFIFKYEFNYVDSRDKAAALSTDQIDIENAKNYNILYTDSDNKRKHPIILHQSPSGGICRVMMAMLERTGNMKNPMLPVWLSPEQVRLLPVNDDYLKLSDSLASKMESKCIRVGIDDRQMSVGKKVFEAKSDWIPYIIVIGEKEVKSKKYPVVMRENSEKKDKIEKMTEKQLIKMIVQKTSDKPFRPMYIPSLVSARPIFVAWSEKKPAKKKQRKKSKKKPAKKKKSKSKKVSKKKSTKKRSEKKQKKK